MERDVLYGHPMNLPSIKRSTPAHEHASGIPSFFVPEDLDEPTFVEPWRKRVNPPVSTPRPAEQAA